MFPDVPRDLRHFGRHIGVRLITDMAKPEIVGSAPILLVKDVIASANDYRDKVGFSYERFWGEPPCFCIL